MGKDRRKGNNKHENKQTFEILRKIIEEQNNGTERKIRFERSQKYKQTTTKWSMTSKMR